MRLSFHGSIPGLALALTLTAGCVARTSDVTGEQTVTVTVSPSDASLYTTQSLGFTASVTGTANRGVTWTVVQGPSGGSVTADGLYTAPSGTGVFQVIAASQFAPSVIGTATVTVSDPPAGGIPMTTANRTAGVAPLAVFFDAVNDTAATSPKYRYAWNSGVAQPADMEGAYFSWNFGDPGSGTWSTTGKGKNAATGYTAAHVYETPGTYTATLTVTDVNGSVSTYAQTITVSDPDVAFASSTRYVAATGSNSNAGTQAAPYLTLARALQDVSAGTAKRVLLRRGDTFALSSVYSVTAAGPGQIGAYGSGARPILNVSELGITNALTVRANDWRFTDLDMLGPSTGTNTGPVGPSDDGQTANTLYLRILARRWKVAFGWGYWASVAAGTPQDAQFVVECEMPNAADYGMYVGGRRLALLGNNAYDSGSTHVARVWQAHKAVISNNHLLRPGGQRHALKLIGIEPNFPTAPETRWLSITDNWFAASGTSQWTVSMGSQSDISAEASLVSHVQFERNRFTASNSHVADIETEASSIVIRNNVFDDSLGSDVVAIIHEQRNPYIQAPTNIRIYNNTAYRSGTFLQTNSTATNLRLRNNLVSAPGSGSVSLLSGTGGTGFAQDHNLVSTAAAASVFTSSGTGDFSLPAGSPAVDAGVSLAEVRQDYLLASRARGAAFDLGAFETR